MRKKLFSTLFLAAIGLGSYIGLSSYVSENETSLIQLEKVEALASSEGSVSWWDRPDYVCRSVICQCLFYSYESDVAEKVPDGTGTVAHTWNCTGCGDCGWTVKN